MYSAQGQTVGSSHVVITSWTSLAAMYVALSRRRDANTVHVATVAEVNDPAQGHQLHRDPVAVLAGLLDTNDPTATRSALAIATGVCRLGRPRLRTRCIPGGRGVLRGAVAGRQVRACAFVRLVARELSPLAHRQVPSDEAGSPRRPSGRSRGPTAEEGRRHRSKPEDGRQERTARR